jgi:Glycosyl hydrolase family 26
MSTLSVPGFAGARRHEGRRQQGLVDTQRLGRHRRTPPDELRAPVRRPRVILMAAIAAISIATAIAGTLVISGIWRHAPNGHPVPQHRSFPITPDSYIGLYSHDAPNSFAGVQAFTMATGVKPRVVVYYSGWQEPFQADFATTVAHEGAVLLVQMNPTRTSVAAIGAGRYDDYLRAYAMAVRAYRHPVILSFGHEMNGYWYSWGHTHTSPAAFVATWRHIVTLFRDLKVQNVTWLWTINTIHKHSGVPSPGPWWPGKSYVNWVGIDGYYINRSSTFSSVFGPTIVYVRTLTHKPILITETSVTPVGSQPTKIADLFAGIRLYGLLGFIWFNSADKVDWRLGSRAAAAAFHREAETYERANHE